MQLRERWSSQTPLPRSSIPAESAIFQIAEDRINQGFVGIPQIVKDSFGSIDNLYQRGQRITGLETHYDKLDEMTSGLPEIGPRHYAARPSMGKTAFAINIAEKCRSHGWQMRPPSSRWKCRASRWSCVCCVRSRASIRTSFAPDFSAGKTSENLPAASIPRARSYFH